MVSFPNITFQDTYFKLSFTERLLVKFLSVAIYSGLFVISLIFISDKDVGRRSLAILIFLFLIDVLMQRSKGERIITGQTVEEAIRGKKINVAPFFKATTKDILEHALYRAELNPGSALILFIIKELADIPEVIHGFERLGIDRKKFMEELIRTIKTFTQSSSIDAIKKEHHQMLYDELCSIALAAFREAALFGEMNVSPTALFLGALNIKSAKLDELFAKFNFSAPDFRNAIILGRLSRGLGKRMIKRRAAIGRKKVSHRIMNRAWTARPTPTLDQFGEDLTDLARANLVGFMIGHENEYQTLINILTREEKNNALLIGVEGIGKNTIVEHLAFQITRDQIPPKLFDRRLVKLSIASLTKNVQSTGELQARLEKIVDEIILAGNIVLYLPDIHNLELTSESGGINAFDMLKPVFQASLIPVIGTTDPQSYRKIIEQNNDFRTLFEKIDVEELTPEVALTLLTYESWILEAKEGITISYPALRRSVELAHRYLRQKPLPASAVDLLQEAIAETKNRRERILTEQIIEEIVSRKTKIPIERPKEAETKLLLELEKKIHERLINQEEAVNAVAGAMRQYRAGLSREKGPIATFLFVGPTGVGKTELAKTLAAIYFGGEDELIRFDMSEYKDPKSIWNFIGSPDGSVSGALIEAIKTKPYAVLLLDEFEKAHYDILELFLPIFDEGYITSSLGERMDMRNMIIIATSNAHSELIKSEVEKGTPFSEIVSMLKRGLTEYFKPELINRFDAIIAFRPLNQEEIEKIALLQLSAILRRLAAQQGIVLNIDPSVPKLLAKLGWDPVYGARPLRAVIRNKVNEMLAKKILSGELKRGSKGTLAVQNDEIILI